MKTFLFKYYFKDISKLTSLQVRWAEETLLKFTGSEDKKATYAI